MEDRLDNNSEQRNGDVQNFYQAYKHMLALLESGTITPEELNIWIDSYDHKETQSPM